METLEDTPVSELPVLPDDIVQQIAEVLKAFGYHDKPETTAPRESVSIGPLPSDFDGEETIWSEVNRAALDHLDAWVPALGLAKCRKSAPNHYEGVAHWRPSNGGRPLSERKPNLKIDGRGIRDFGDERGYSPLTLIMSACGCTLDEAYAWLRDLVLPKQTTITLQPRAAELPPHDPETGEILEDPPEVHAPVPEEIEPVPVEVTKPAPVDFENLTHIPGLLGDMVDWIEGTARKPSRILALGVSIAALGTILGRRFASPTNLRTNFYVITLAGSAYGKGHPMKATKALFEAAGMLNFLGGSKIRSDAGLRRAIEQKGTLLYLIDEIGEPLATWLGKTKSGHHLTAVRSMLLEFFSNADSIYQGDDYHEGQTPPIYNPNLSFYGTTTPEDFWRALQGSNVADGFLPRFLVFPLNGKRPQEVEPPLPPDPPGELIERLQNIIMPVRKGNMTGLVHVPGTAKVQAYPVPWGEGALDLWRDMGQQQDDAVDRADPAERSILARRNEHAQKLALIRAVGQDPQQPLIQSADLEWGLAVVNASIEASLREAKDMIADNQFQADYLRILKLVGEAGPKGMTRRELLKGLKGCIERRKVEDIIAMLKEGGEVDEAPFKSTRGPPRVALVRREYP